MYTASGSPNPVWRGLIRHLIAKDPIPCRDGKAIFEEVGASLHFPFFGPHFIYHPSGRRTSPVYALAECAWYLCVSADSALTKAFDFSHRHEFILEYAPSYASHFNFVEVDGVMTSYDYGNYGQRMRGQFRLLIRELLNTDNSRRALLPIFNVQDLGNAVHFNDAHGEPCYDIPCTSSLQFLLRGGELNMIVTMRSNDMWLGHVYDVFAFSMIQSLIASIITAKTGSYTHNIGSCHLYDDKNSIGKYERVVNSPEFVHTYDFPKQALIQRSSSNPDIAAELWDRVIEDLVIHLGIHSPQESFTRLLENESRILPWQIRLMIVACNAQFVNDKTLSDRVFNLAVPEVDRKFMQAIQIDAEARARKEQSI